MAKHTLDFNGWGVRDWIEGLSDFLVSCGVATIINTQYDTYGHITNRAIRLNNNPRAIDIRTYAAYFTYLRIDVYDLNDNAVVATLYNSYGFMASGTLVCCEGENSVIVWVQNLATNVFTLFFVATKDEYGNPLILRNDTANVSTDEEGWHIKAEIVGKLGDSNYICAPSILVDNLADSEVTQLYALMPHVFGIVATDPWNTVEHLTSENGEFVYYYRESDTDYLYRI